jgi:hypothetical protein
MKYLILICCIIAFTSCSNSYNQSFDTYQDFEKANERNKGWFPKLMDNSCSEIKGISNLSEHENFGKFNYQINGKIDSIFSDKTGTQRISTNEFQIKLVDIKTETPDWFITKDKVMGKSIWIKDGYYFAKDSIHHVVYFLSNKK